MGGFFLPMLETILKDRRLWLLGLLGILAFTLARWVVAADTAFAWVAKGGYWVILICFLLFMAAVWQVVKEACSSDTTKRSEYVGVVILILAVGCVWQVHETRGFKILADEVLLLGTSMDMHLEREATYPIRATDVQGPFQILTGVLDKRPLFFPFVVSLVHDLTGYRATNSFYVNAVLGFLFLALVYLVCRKVTKQHWAGVLGVLLFAGLPLMAQQTAGGGFELLNLIMLLGVLWLGCRYAERPNCASAAALCLGAVLLAQTRYESAIFIVPVAGLMIWGWARAEKVILPWSIWLTPVFLMPYVLQNRQFGSNESLWELAGQGGGATVPFSVNYLPENLGHALAFFFDTSGFQPNSILFALLGLIALPLFGIWITRVIREHKNQSPVTMAVAMFSLGLLAVGGLFMIYFWGQIDDPVIRRLSLPMHLTMMLAIVVVVSHWIRWTRIWQVLCACAVAALLVQGLPAMAKRAYEKEYTPGVEMAWRQDFLERFPERDYLFIDQDSVFWITQEIPATPIKQAQERKEGLIYHLRNRSFSAMYVFQRYKIDDLTGKMNLDPNDDVGEGFGLEPVWEKRIATLLIGRISRITSISHEDDKVEATPYITPSGEEHRTAEQIEKARALYLENWIKQLP